VTDFGLAEGVQAAAFSPPFRPPRERRSLPARAVAELGDLHVIDHAELTDSRLARHVAHASRIQNRNISMTCAPSATRTRDLLLRRHFPNVAPRRPVSPDVASGCSENG
jgi:hypothetical protein